MNIYKLIFKSVRLVETIINSIKSDYHLAKTEVTNKEFIKNTLAVHFPGQSSFPKKLTK